MKRITDWVIVNAGGGQPWLEGFNGRGKCIQTSVITERTGRFTCRTQSGSEYLLVGPSARPDVLQIMEVDHNDPLSFLEPGSPKPEVTG